MLKSDEGGPDREEVDDDVKTSSCSIKPTRVRTCKEKYKLYEGKEYVDLCGSDRMRFSHQ